MTDAATKIEPKFIGNNVIDCGDGTTIFKLPTNARMTKEECFEAVQNMMVDRTLPSNTTLAQMFNYFAPKPRITTKSALAWVGVACSNDPHRFNGALQYIYVSEDGVAYGTDGTRMHWCKTDYPTGYYDPKTLAMIDDVELEHPDHRRLIDSEIYICDGYLPLPKPVVKKSATNGKILSSYYDLGYEEELNNMVFDSKLMDEAVMGAGEVFFQVSANLALHSRITLKGHECNFIIMPMKRPECEVKASKLQEVPKGEPEQEVPVVEAEAIPEGAPVKASLDVAGAESAFKSAASADLPAQGEEEEPQPKKSDKPRKKSSIKKKG